MPTTQCSFLVEFTECMYTCHEHHSDAKQMLSLSNCSSSESSVGRRKNRTMPERARRCGGVGCSKTHSKVDPHAAQRCSQLFSRHPCNSIESHSQHVVHTAPRTQFTLALHSHVRLGTVASPCMREVQSLAIALPDHEESKLQIVSRCRCNSWKCCEGKMLMTT